MKARGAERAPQTRQGGAAVSLFAFFVAGSAVHSEREGNDQMMHGAGLGMWWTWLFGALAVAGVIVLIVVIVRLAAGGIRQNQQPKSTPLSTGAHSPSTPRQVLDERYARGELTTEEYRERLAALTEGR